LVPTKFNVINGNNKNKLILKTASIDKLILLFNNDDSAIIMGNSNAVIIYAKGGRHRRFLKKKLYNSAKNKSR